MEVFLLDINVGDILEMKKPHPCKCKTFLVLRVGMDFKLQCENCKHQFMISRKRAEKNIKNVISQKEDQTEDQTEVQTEVQTQDQTEDLIEN